MEEEVQKFTIEEFKNFLAICDSFVDALYFCNVENVIKANSKDTEDEEES